MILRLVFALAFLLGGALPAAAQIILSPQRITGGTCSAGDFISAVDLNGSVTCGTPAGGGAPTDAEYWTGAAHASLSAEKNLGALGTGLVKNTAGVPSIYAGGACGAGDFVLSLDASGALTCGTPSGGGAPTTVKYWVGQGDAGLSAEMDLGALTTGLVLNTVAVGVGTPSTYAGAAACSNQFVTAISASGATTCTTDTLASAQHANQGTTTTLLHGNAAGNPSFGAVVSADLNITGTTCTNQFVSALSSAAAGTCTTATLAGAQFANQGTTTTVLHGNAAGNPSFGAVVEADQTLADNTTNDVSTTKHGYVPKAPGDSTKFLNGANPPAWAVPAGGSGARFFFLGGHGSSETVSMFCNPMGYGIAQCLSSSTFRTRLLVPASGAIKNLRAWLSVAQGTSDVCIFNVRTGTDPTATPSATTLTCTVGDTQQSCTDLVNTPAVTAGEGIEMHFNESAGTCTGEFRWSFELTPS